MNALHRVLCVALLTAGFAAPAWSSDFEQGVHYHELATTADTRENGQPVEISAFLWYGCGGCYHVEPALQALKQRLPEGVTLKLYPALLGGAWDIHGRLMLTLQELDVDHSVHMAAFETIQSRKSRLIDNREIHDFLVANDIDEGDFIRIYNSPELTRKMAAMKLRQQAYGVEAVPTVVVGGRYAYDLGTAGSPDDFIALAEQLSAKITD